MTPDPQKLAQHLRKTAVLLEAHGAAMLQRAHDWTLPPRQGEGHQWTRGGGLADPDQPSDDNETDHRENQQAARIHSRLTRLLERMGDDATELGRIQAELRIAEDESSRTLQPKEMQLAQLVADGYCGSCARDRNERGEPHLKDVAKGRYSDRCRFCGDYRGENKGQDPPLALVKAKHAAEAKGRNLTTRVVDAVLGRSA